MTPTTIHYDCDPGQDDAIALLFALGAGVKIQSLSVVGGNADVRKCAVNALQLLELTGRQDIRLYVGAAQPLKRLSHPLPDVFGESGMDGANLPPPILKPQTQYAADFLAQADLPKTLVATGPLTNLALAVQQDPSFANRIEHLVIMGGCLHPDPLFGRLGNIQVEGSQGWAEYNFFVDPEAAQSVFRAGFKNITLIDLNLPRKVLYNGKLDAALRANGNRSSIVAANILTNYAQNVAHVYKAQQTYEGEPICSLYDVVAMAYVTDPELFTTQNHPVRIVVEPPPAAAGQSIIDPQNYDHPNIRLAVDIDRALFADRLVQYLKNLP